MTVTFSNNPANSNRDLVRILIDDTTGKLSDETIGYFLTSEPSVWYAAAMCADLLAGQMAAKGSLTVGDLSVVSWLSAPQYRALAKQFRVRGSMAAVPYMGGRTESLKQSEASDSDRVAPAFTVGMHDDPGSST